MEYREGRSCGLNPIFEMTLSNVYGITRFCMARKLENYATILTQSHMADQSSRQRARKDLLLMFRHVGARPAYQYAAMFHEVCFGALLWCSKTSANVQCQKQGRSVSTC